jgi:hypothetical protein
MYRINLPETPGVSHFGEFFSAAEETPGPHQQDTGRAEDVEAAPDIGGGVDNVFAEPFSTEDNSAVSGDYEEVMPYKIVNLVGCNANLLRVNVKLNETVVNAVIDSGSVYSLISLELANKLNLTIYPIETALRVIGNNNFKTLGKCKCSLAINAVNVTDLNLCVFPNSSILSGDLFLGMDFLVENMIELCIRDRIIVKHLKASGKVEIHLDNSGVPARLLYCDINCYAAQDVDVARCTTECIPINFSIPSGEADQLLLYSDDDIDRRLAERVK